jgi:hypothetical protein
MENKFKIVETEEYTLAVSDEEIKKGDYNLTNGVEVFNQSDVKEFTLEYANRYWQKAVAYQPKGEKKLDLPLLPEMVVEDDVEKLLDEKYPYEVGYSVSDENSTIQAMREAFIEGHKAATKVYSEEDLRKAYRAGMDYQEGGVILYPDEEGYIQTLKQPKTPKWFVAEMEYYYHTSKEFYSDAGFVKCTKEQYESIKSEIPTCPLKTELKTTTINGKTYLVGKYEK